MRFSKLSSLILLSTLACTESPDDPIIAEYPTCSTDGQIACVARADYPAVDKALLAANLGNLRSGNSIAGLTGTLNTCAADNGISCVTSAEYPSVVKADVTAATIINGSILAGVSGTFAAPCAADGQVDCLSTPTFKAVRLSTITSFDVRAGSTFGGLAGTTAFYRNASTLSIFNRTTGDGSNVSTGDADNYDTIDDAAGGMAIPITMTAGASNVQSNWIREPTTDTDSDETCNGSESCAYLDRFTGLSWLSDNGMPYTWEAAITSCESLTIAGTSDWRIPTQKELQQAYVNRIYGLRIPMALTTGQYFSSTSVSSLLTNYAWGIRLAYGETSAQDKGVSAPHVLCVR